MLQPWTCHCSQHNAGSGPCSRCLNAPPAWVAAPAPAPARPRRAVVALAITIAALLVAGTAGAVVVGFDDDGPPQDRAGAPAPEAGGGQDDGGRTVLVGPGQAPPAGPGDLERALPGLMRFVETARGLSFRAPVKVTLLPDEPFRKRLQDTEESPTRAEEVRTVQRVLQGLGLLDRDVDLQEALDSLFGAAVAGFYDTEKDDLVVRGDRLTPGRRVTLVHELTHALQDQHFTIDRDEFEERDDESADGLTGLVEGDAVRIERQYLESLPNREQKAVEAEEAAVGTGIDPSVPQVLLELVGFPYIVGPGFTEQVFEQGGQARLDAAFAEPPSTSEQLLHPELFLAGQGPAPVTTPHPDGQKIDEGVLGEFGLLLFLREAIGSGAAGAARGWGGDRYVAWRDDNLTCVRAAISMDTPEATARLRSALDRVARERRRVAVRGDGPIVFTSCG